MERDLREQQRIMAVPSVAVVLYGVERRSRGERAKLFLREHLGRERKRRKKAHLAQREKMGKRCLTVFASLRMRKLLYGSVSSIQSFRAPPLIADDLTSHFSLV